MASQRGFFGSFFLQAVLGAILFDGSISAPGVREFVVCVQREVGNYADQERKVQRCLPLVGFSVAQYGGMVLV